MTHTLSGRSKSGMRSHTKQSQPCGIPLCTGLPGRMNIETGASFSWSCRRSSPGLLAACTNCASRSVATAAENTSPRWRAQSLGVSRATRLEAASTASAYSSKAICCWGWVGFALASSGTQPTTNDCAGASSRQGRFRSSVFAGGKKMFCIASRSSSRS